MLCWKCHSPSSSVQSISKAVRATRPLIALIAVHVWKRPVVKDKHIKMKPRIYVLCVFDLDGEYKFIKNKTLWLLKKYVLGCNLGWMNRRFCIQKDGRNVNGVQHSFLRHRQKQKSTTNRSENSSARVRTYERTDWRTCRKHNASPSAVLGMGDGSLKTTKSSISALQLVSIVF